MRIERYSTIEVPDELPDTADIKSGEFYFSPEYHCVKFLCPCGCGIQVYLHVSLDWAYKKQHPGERIWLFRQDSGPTLSPSIQQLGYCQSHYNIQDGVVEWAGMPA